MGKKDPAWLTNLREAAQPLDRPFSASEPLPASCVVDLRSDRFRAAVQHVFDAPGEWGPAQGYYGGHIDHFIDMLEAAYLHRRGG